mmetsp:Transcript_43202/g.94170  ORF Transcript_43202/g.94170 Transcript_43202/m.94170 type:complete len:234 (-) Transcript_43202:161-862(-)
MAANVIGAPAQETMANDPFAGAKQLRVIQEWAAVEFFSCEAKNRYRVSLANDGTEGPVVMYIAEESGFCERICCSVNRSLKFNIHQGASKEGPVIQSMHKPFHLQGCCCMRPKFDVFGPGSTPIGTVEDPFKCCVMDQRILDSKGTQLLTTRGSVCQIGMLCPFFGSVDFDILKNGQPVAKVSKMAMGCGECLTKTNRFNVDFGGLTDPLEKRLMFAAVMLLDLEYFEVNKNN